MRWEDEDYVKVYKNPSPEFLAMSWQARGLFGELMKAVDRAGVLKCGKLLPARAVAVALRTTDVASIEGPLAELLEDGCVVFQKDRQILFVPNFVTAQSVRHTDRVRKLRQREADANEIRGISSSAQDAVKTALACHTESHPVTLQVTAGHTPSHDVTPSHKQEEKRREEKRREERETGDKIDAPSAPLPPEAKSGKRIKAVEPVAYRIPEDWRPTDEQVEALRLKHRVEPLAALEDFVGCFVSMDPKNRNAKKTRWDLAFARWVKKEAAEGNLPVWIPPPAPPPKSEFTDAERAENIRRLGDLFGDKSKAVGE